MIYFDSSALLKFVKPEKESNALREWRVAQPTDSELVSSQLAVLQISRTLMRAGVDHQRVPYVVGQAVRGLYLVDVTSTVLTRARVLRHPATWIIGRHSSGDCGSVPRRDHGLRHLRR